MPKKAKVIDASANLSTAPGLGYEYRWDANSDGEFETGWTSSSETSFEYSESDVRNMVIQAMASGSGDAESETEPVVVEDQAA